MKTATIENEPTRAANRETLSRRPADGSCAMKLIRLLLVGGLALAPSWALVDEGLDSGDTAWMLTATALVLFMTIPGLALFYSGMVRSKNVLSVLMQCFAITSLMSILWIFWGYSLAFEDGGSANRRPTPSEPQAHRPRSTRCP